MVTAMAKYFSIVFSLCLLTLVVGAKAQDKATSRSIQVKLHYTGNGTVDEHHKIFVAIWDSPDFMSGTATMPMLVKATDSKDGTVTFSDFTKSPVYVSSVYDPNGTWDGQSGPPPSGSSLGLYSKTPGKPEPVDVEPGKTEKIVLTFNDTAKMP